ncbi:MAG TPA: formimidoylglutamate deiminase [Myxococcales bacterium]|nr:formimidoylglutamate deiminase [Deltaproteobacteria bacterium]MBU54578.1 formimidoylglutamate deiminase [Deltaproteobacteria bacterium]HAA54021.1 formimidoylglutamate deiminase [Myxococcales bacterium]|tara:strand:+ start:1691 stop:3061 length:1371 start_codon:yes stop_codon:yes gene_type:complete
MARFYEFDALLQKEGWLSPAFVGLDDEGNITYLSDQPYPNAALVEKIEGYVVPGFQNAHSHAFQYAMAGLAEHLPKGAASDDFWSWRNAMYDLALHTTPEQMKAIATMLYAEMLRHGYTSVAEFHYLHHDPDGNAYEDLAEMGHCLMQAAQDVGIRITLVPIYYQLGGFETPATPKQRRFLSQCPEEYMALLDATQKAASHYPLARVGMGIHSMRAVPPEYIVQLYQQPMALPRHIHIAEQQKEIDACLAQLKQRPVEWLLDHVELGTQDHLVHATHMDEQECDRLAASGAHVVLCPSTEGNLGDGLFPLKRYVQQGGHWSIGTDSHVGLNPHEELRWLDYGQRLHFERRNILCQREGDDSGEYAFFESLFSGRRAMGDMRTTCFSIGESFDAAIYDATHPLLACAPAARRLSTIVYALDAHALLGTMVQGVWRIREQRHPQQQQIRASFVRALSG